MAKEPSKIKQATVQKSVNQRAFSRAVNRAARLTDENYHTESLMVFSRHFKYDDLTKELKAIDKEHNAAGHLTRELYERRTRAMNTMFDRIRNEYGEDTLRKVSKGL